MIGMSDLQHPVELFLGCRDLKKMDTFGTSDPKVKVMMKRQGQWVTVGETEIVKNTLNPDFKTTIVVDYTFEVVQPLRFEITDYDAIGRNDYHGMAETTLGEVIGAPKQTESLAIFARGGNIEGKLIVRADKNELSHNVIFWQWSAFNLMNLAGCMGKSSPFLKFYKQKQDGWFAIHETEVVTKNLNPNWQLFKVNDHKLCGSVHNRPIKIECLAKQNGKNSVIGACEVTLEKIKNGETTFTLKNPTSIKPTGTIKAVNYAVQARQSFIDFIRGGEQLHSIVAIDFTNSNGDPKTENSLHARLPNGALNDYQQAIMNVCGIIQYYDKQKLFPVFGFGARPKYEEGINQRKVSHCFPCSGIEGKSEVAGIQGILDVYQFALDNVELQGPTHFAPIIEEAMKVCQVHKNNDADVYTIFLILTDGEIHDIKETVDLLVKAAFLPLSIIMVGLGPADFTKMEMFENGKELVGSNNEKCARSLVQFVPFRNFKNDMVELTKRVLAHIPEQLVDYKAYVNKTPKPALF